MKNLPLKDKNTGQALLVVLLIMSVVLTIVLSVASRSVIDVSLTTYEADSLRAFSAAEAGVEQALLTGAYSGTPITVDPGDTTSATYTSNISTGATGGDFTHPESVVSGQSVTFWFVSHNAIGALTCSGGAPCTTSPNLEVCWGNVGTPSNSPNTPAVELSIFYDYDPLNTSLRLATAITNDFRNIKVRRFTADPNTSRSLPPIENKFDAASLGCGLGANTFAFSTGSINLNTELPVNCATGPQGCLVMGKVRMFYNSSASHPIAIRAFGGLSTVPAQGTQIESTGVAGESVRRLSIFQGYPEPPTIFDAAVYSGGNLSK